MKHARLIASTLTLCLLLAGCGQGAANSSSPESVPSVKAEVDWSRTDAHTLLGEINDLHKAIQKPQPNPSDYIPETAPGEAFDVFSHTHPLDYDPSTPLTLEQTQEDLEVLFRTLSSTYGPYAYFGGDAAFSAAKEQVLADCQQAQETWRTVDLEASLQTHLSFLVDAHFTISDHRSSTSHLPYHYTELAFGRGPEGYYALEDKRVVTSVDGWEDLDHLFRPSLTEEGTVAYFPLVLQPKTDDSNDLPDDLTVHFQDGSTQTLSTTAWTSSYDESDRMVDLHYNNGVPVLFVRNMGFDKASGDTMGRDFMAYAEQLKEEPVLILDLRSNGGGNSVLSLKWLAAYAGQRVTTNSVSFDYWTQADLEAYGTNTENQFYVPLDEMKEFCGYDPVNDAYMILNNFPDEFVSNPDRLLILLTGKNTASAAEMFVDASHNLENTLVIGENTYGMLINNAYTVIYLPNSGIPVQLGTNLTVFPAGDFQEYVGYQPDLWVQGDAEEAAVRWVKNQYQTQH